MCQALEPNKVIKKTKSLTWVMRSTPQWYQHGREIRRPWGFNSPTSCCKALTASTQPWSSVSSLQIEFHGLCRHKIIHFLNFSLQFVSAIRILNTKGSAQQQMQNKLPANKYTFVRSCVPDKLTVCVRILSSGLGNRRDWEGSVWPHPKDAITQVQAKLETRSRLRTIEPVC